jgi:hypothetical protein
MSLGSASDRLLATTRSASGARRIGAARSPGILEMALQIRRKGRLQFLMDMWRTQGDLPHLRVGRSHLLLTIHPEYLLSGRGRRWLTC